MSLLALCAAEKLNGAEPGGTITCTVAARAAASGWWSEVLPVTLEKAIKLLEKEYERAKNLEYVHKPLAYALYHVWKMADEERKDND